MAKIACEGRNEEGSGVPFFLCVVSFKLSACTEVTLSAPLSPWKMRRTQTHVKSTCVPCLTTPHKSHRIWCYQREKLIIGVLH